MKSGHTYYIEDELYKKIKELAKKEERSESQIISRILENYLKVEKNG